MQLRVSVGGSPFLEQQHDFLEGAVACLRDSEVIWQAMVGRLIEHDIK